VVYESNGKMLTMLRHLAGVYKVKVTVALFSPQSHPFMRETDCSFYGAKKHVCFLHVFVLGHSGRSPPGFT